MQPVVDIVVVWSNPRPCCPVGVIGVNSPWLNCPETSSGACFNPLDMTISISVIFAAQVRAFVVASLPVTPTDPASHTRDRCIKWIAPRSCIRDPWLVACPPHEGDAPRFNQHHDSCRCDDCCLREVAKANIDRVCKVILRLALHGKLH